MQGVFLTQAAQSADIPGSAPTSEVVWRPSGQPACAAGHVGSDLFVYLPPAADQKPIWDADRLRLTDPWDADPDAIARGRSVQSKADLWMLSLTSQMACRDTSFDPDTLVPDQTWHTDETV